MSKNILDLLTTHPYYCEVYYSGTDKELSSWAEFKSSMDLDGVLNGNEEYYFNFNYFFRYDIQKNEDDNEVYLRLVMIQQRKGKLMGFRVKIENEDYDDVSKFIELIKAYAKKMWGF